MDSSFKKYVNKNGHFEFPNFLYHTINGLMKATLDMGNLACADQNQLRAYKEMTKRQFKNSWQSIANCLEELDIIKPCICNDTDFCDICGGSRFLANDLLQYDELEEVFSFVAAGVDDSSGMSEKLKKGLASARQIQEKFLNERS